MRCNVFDKIVYTIISILLFIFYFSTINTSVIPFDLDSFLIYLTFILIGFVSFIEFIIDRRFLSINKMINVFIMLFCSMAPLNQYTRDYNVWGLSNFDNDDYLIANFMILLFMIIYFACYHHFSKKCNSIEEEKKTYNFSINTTSLFIGIILSVGCFIFLYLTGNLIDVSAENSDKGSLVIFLLKIIYFFPVANFLTWLYGKKYRLYKCGNSLYNLFGFINAAIVFIVFFPFNGSISRYLLLGTYLAIIYVLTDKFKKSSIILLSMIIGFYYLFPALNFFKYHTIYELNEFQFGGFDFNSHDYDAYQMFMLSIKYTSTNGILFGKNVLSAIFCLIPRSLWLSKLDPSGAIIAEQFGAKFTNLSCPIFAEAFLAFGYFGIVIFPIMIAKIVQVVERKSKDNNLIYKLINSVLVGLILYYFRGAMLPATSFIYGLCVACVCCYLLYKKGLFR